MTFIFDPGIITKDDIESVTTENSGVFDTKDSDGNSIAGFKDTYVITNAPREIVFNVINDVEKYPQFLKIYSSVHIISSETDLLDSNKKIRVVRYNIAVPYILKPFFKDLYYILKLTSYYDKLSHTETMYWEQIEGPPFLTDNSGRWDVQEHNNDIKIYLQMNLGYSFYLPYHLKKYIMNHILNDSMQNIKKRVLNVLGRDN